MVRPSGIVTRSTGGGAGPSRITASASSNDESSRNR